MNISGRWQCAASPRPHMLYGIFVPNINMPTVSYMPPEQAMGGEVTLPVRPVLPGGNAL